MGVNPQGIWSYSDADIVQSWPAFMNLGFNTVSDVIKSIQQNRALIAKSINDQRDKIAAINKATTGSYDLLVYRSDLNEMYLATNTGIKKIWGGAPDIKYINDNEAFSQWRRYTQHGASAVISRNVSIPSQGLWLFPTVLRWTTTTPLRIRTLTSSSLLATACSTTSVPRTRTTTLKVCCRSVWRQWPTTRLVLDPFRCR